MKRLTSLAIVVSAAVFPTAVPGQQLLPDPPAVANTGRKSSPRSPADSLGQLSAALQRLAAEVSPAVAQIEVTGFAPAVSEDPAGSTTFIRRHWTGAGVVVDPDGYIMTNAHVVEGAERIQVLLSHPPSHSDESYDGSVRVLNARLLGEERLADLALLKVEATGLPTLAFDLDGPPQPGELVLAIGSPSGLRNTVTMGVISSGWRQPEPNNPMVYLQTDAPISPGSSGGPLVDVTGAVVGLNTFILNGVANTTGLGFAIPARVVRFVYESLRKQGRVDHVEIGAFAQAITPTMAQGLALEREWGVVIADVVPFGPAHEAGILPGDIVLAVDGHAIANLPWFAAALLQHPPHEDLSVEVLRGSRRLSLRVAARVARDPLDQLAEVADPMASYVQRLGILALALDEKLLPMLSGIRAAGGVVVLAPAPGFGSFDVGLRPGDVIHSLNRTIVGSVEQLSSEVARLKSGDAVVLRIERSGQFQFLAFEID
jgi:serine protease Do